MILIQIILSSLANDQTEINRIIAEASKGSKYYEVGLPSSVFCLRIYLSIFHAVLYSSWSLTYSGGWSWQNEKKKDKDLTERIARILKQRDDVVKGADIGTLTLVLVLVLPIYSCNATPAHVWWAVKVEAAVDRLVSP